VKSRNQTSVAGRTPSGSFTAPGESTLNLVFADPPLGFVATSFHEPLFRPRRSTSQTSRPGNSSVTVTGTVSFFFTSSTVAPASRNSPRTVTPSRISVSRPSAGVTERSRGARPRCGGAYHRSRLPAFAAFTFSFALPSPPSPRIRRT